MENPEPNYRREFLKSPHHAWFGLLTLGLGFISTQPLFLLAGATAYALGWIYLPDVGFFRRWVDRRHNAAQQAAARAQLEDFLKRREALLREISYPRRERYQALALVCRDIENASAKNATDPLNIAMDPRLRKLDELMWTYLRLLHIEESLDRFLETERHENLPGRIHQAEEEIATLNEEIQALKKNNPASADARQKLLDSRLELLEVLRKRLQRSEQAQSNLALVLSEQERLAQQIKLIRADSLAVSNTESLSARIDATVENLDQTNQWINELNQFKDLVGDLPPVDVRVGYAPLPIPPVISSSPAPPRPTIKARK